MINLIHTFAALGSSCNPTGSRILGFPHWYEYMDGMRAAGGKCTPSLIHLNDLWLIAAAAIEILVRLAGIIAVVMIIFGAFTYVTSQGEPEPTAKARGTIINALIGLVVAISAASLIAFVAKNVHN